MKETTSYNGIFSLYDPTGKMLCQTHNMIVKSGRRQIMSAGFPTPTDSRVLYLFMSSDDSLTTPEMEYDADEMPAASSVAIADPEKDEAALCYKISGSIIGSTENCGEKNSGGLYFTEGDSNTLFSRFTCNPVSITVGKKYAFTYYIYF